MVTTPVSSYGESTKPIEIDEGEDIERLTSLKQRETLLRGMGESIKVIHLKKNEQGLFFLFNVIGVIDMCHRLLFGTTGTMANIPTATAGTTNGNYHNVRKTVSNENKING